MYRDYTMCSLMYGLVLLDSTSCVWSVYYKGSGNARLVYNVKDHVTLTKGGPAR